MKVKRFQFIDGCKIIMSIEDPTVSPEATKVRALSILFPEMSVEKIKELSLNDLSINDGELKRLLKENEIYAQPGPGGELIEDEEAEEIKEKLAAIFEKGEKTSDGKTDISSTHEVLRDEGDIIIDYRGVEYWLKSEGTWVKKKIIALGMPIPDDAVLPDALTQEQQDEINVQQEVSRIAGLTPEKRAMELEAALNAAKTEARIKRDEADIADEVFDAKAWYAARKAKLEAKYDNLM